MNPKPTIWIIFVVIGFITLLLVPSVRRAKYRAQHISTVNHVSSVSLTLTNVSALPGAQPGTGK